MKTFIRYAITFPCIVLVTSFINIQNTKLHQCTISTSSLGNISWILNRFKDIAKDKNKNIEFEDQVINSNKDDAHTTLEKDKNKKGKVIRCAARAYKEDGSSRPSSPNYTTQKDEFPSLLIDTSGVVGDYNHYRTTALSSTKDRAVSIITNDVMKVVSNEGVYDVKPGDLGENILVDEVTFRYFQVGQKYFIGDVSSDDDKLRRGIEIEITEPMVPCANLCKLPIINQSNLPPKLRIERCMDFLKRLDYDVGFRGWYAKILGNGGEVRLGDGVMLLH